MTIGVDTATNSTLPVQWENSHGSCLRTAFASVSSSTLGGVNALRHAHFLLALFPASAPPRRNIGAKVVRSAAARTRAGMCVVLGGEGTAPPSPPPARHVWLRAIVRARNTVTPLRCWSPAAALVRGREAAGGGVAGEPGSCGGCRGAVARSCGVHA